MAQFVFTQASTKDGQAQRLCRHPSLQPCEHPGKTKSPAWHKNLRKCRGKAKTLLRYAAQGGFVSEERIDRAAKRLDGHHGHTLPKFLKEMSWRNQDWKKDSWQQADWSKGQSGSSWQQWRDEEKKKADQKKKKEKARKRSGSWERTPRKEYSDMEKFSYAQRMLEEVREKLPSEAAAAVNGMATALGEIKYESLPLGRRMKQVRSRIVTLTRLEETAWKDAETAKEAAVQASRDLEEKRELLKYLEDRRRDEGEGDDEEESEDDAEAMDTGEARKPKADEAETQKADEAVDAGQRTLKEVFLRQKLLQPVLVEASQPQLPRRCPSDTTSSGHSDATSELREMMKELAVTTSTSIREAADTKAAIIQVLKDQREESDRKMTLLAQAQDRKMAILAEQTAGLAKEVAEARGPTEAGAQKKRVVTTAPPVAVVPPPAAASTAFQKRDAEKVKAKAVAVLAEEKAEKGRARSRSRSPEKEEEKMDGLESSPTVALKEFLAGTPLDGASIDVDGVSPTQPFPLATEEGRQQ